MASFSVGFCVGISICLVIFVFGCVALLHDFVNCF